MYISKLYNLSKSSLLGELFGQSHNKVEFNIYLKGIDFR